MSIHVPSFSSTKNTATTTKETQNNLKQTLNTSLQENMEKNTIYYVERNSDNANRIDYFQDLEKEHSLRDIKDFLNNSFLWGAHITMNKKQANQVGLDMSKLMQWQKWLYMEFNYYSNKVNYVYNYQLETEEIDLLYKEILKDFVKPPQKIKDPAGAIISRLNKLAWSIEMYKTSKIYNNGLSVKSADKIAKLIEVLERKWVKVLFNIYNLLHGIIWQNMHQYEGQINGIAQSFANSPFKLIISEFETKQDNQRSKPKVWSDMKEIKLSLPIEEDYKKVLKQLFKGNKLSESYQQAIKENPKLIKEITKTSQGLYLRYFQEHITNYISSHDKFEASDFIEGLNKYKFKSINSMSNKSLEIIDNKLTFSNVWGVKSLKNTFNKLANSIKEYNDKKIIKSYLLAWIPGTGKSLTAKAITNEFSEITGKKWIWIRLNISSLFDMYVWNTEKNFQEASRILEGISKSNDGRIVLWIDEIEKALGSGNNSSHWVDEKLMGEILTTIEDKWMRKFIIIATVNNVMNLSAELKWRFVNKFFFDNPSEEARTAIIKIKIAEFWYKFDKNEIQSIVEKTKNFVWREIENIFSLVKQETHNLALQALEEWEINLEQVKNAIPTLYWVEEILEIEKNNIQHINSKEQIWQYREKCKNFRSADDDKIKEEEKLWKKERDKKLAFKKN